MTTTITLARLHDLRLSGMAQALTQQQEQSSTYEALPFLERLGLLVEQECLVRDQRKQDRLIRQARFKLRATVQDIDYQHPRNLQPAQIARLAQGDWLQRGTKPAHYRSLAAVAKPSWPVPWDTMPACTGIRPAITACRACCLPSPRPRPTAATTNCWLRPPRSGYCSSMIGAWRLLTTAQRHDLMEIMDDRHGSASTVMVSQLPVDQWYVTVGDNTLADALLDRLIHNAHRLALKGESMRKKMVQLTEREHLS